MTSQERADKVIWRFFGTIEGTKGFAALIAAAIDDAVAAEREACAQLVLAQSYYREDIVAKHIREREKENHL